MKWLVAMTVILIVLAVIAPGTLLDELFFGWYRYLVRGVSERTVNIAALASIGVCLVALLVITHAFGRWIKRDAAERDPKASVSAWPLRLSLTLVGLIVTLFVAGITMIAVTHQTVWLFTAPEARFPTHRIFLTLTFMDLSLAPHNYHDKNKSFPPGFSVDANDRTLHSWQTHLLPFLESRGVYKEIDLSRPWNDAVNRKAMQTPIPSFTFHYPDSLPQFVDGFGASHVAGNMHVLGSTKGLNIAKDIPDGTSNTLFIGEIATLFPPWGQPTPGRDPGLGLNKSPFGFGTLSGNKSVEFAFCDGGVRAIRNDMPPQILKMLATPAGGETLPSEWWSD